MLKILQSIGAGKNPYSKVDDLELGKEEDEADVEGNQSIIIDGIEKRYQAKLKDAWVDDGSLNIINDDKGKDLIERWDMDIESGINL